MSQYILSDRSPLNRSVSPRLPWMLKPLTAGQQVAVVAKSKIPWNNTTSSTGPILIALSHPNCFNHYPDFKIKWVLKGADYHLALLELYLWRDPEELSEMEVELQPGGIWGEAGVTREVREIFPQTLIKVANPGTLTVISEQEFAAAMPRLFADIASRWHLDGGEWNGRYREDVKAVFGL